MATATVRKRAKKTKPPKPKALTKKQFCLIVEGLLNMSSATIANAPSVNIAVDPFGRARDAKGRFLNSRNVERTPTLKQIWKFTQSYMQALRNTIESRRRPRKLEDRFLSVDEYASLVREIHRYNLAIDHEIVQVIQNLGESIQSKAHLLGYLMNQIDEYAAYRIYAVKRESNNNKVGMVNAADVANDLLAICKNFPTVWDRENKTLKIITEPISIINPRNNTLRYNFGRFFILLKSNSIQKPIIKAHTPRISKNRSNCIHPHVMTDGDMCFGDGGHSMNKALKAGRLFDVVEITMSILSQLGRNPYANIEDWNGVCDERFDPTTGLTVPVEAVLTTIAVQQCGICDAEVSQIVNCSHGSDCTVSGCTGCLDLCSAEGCTNYSCDNHYWVCDNCGGRFCAPDSQSSHFTNESEFCNRCYDSMEDGDDE